MSCIFLEEAFMCLEECGVGERGKEVKTSIGSNWLVVFGMCMLFVGVFLVSVVSDGFVCVCVCMSLCQALS